MVNMALRCIVSMNPGFVNLDRLRKLRSTLTYIIANILGN